MGSGFCFPQARQPYSRKAIRYKPIGLCDKVPERRCDKVPEEYVTKCPCITDCFHRVLHLAPSPMDLLPDLNKSPQYRRRAVVKPHSLLVQGEVCFAVDDLNLLQSARKNPPKVHHSAILMAKLLLH